MERIKAGELPAVLTDDIINTLAHMADEFPMSEEWRAIIKVLPRSDYRKIMDRRIEIQKKEQMDRREAMTDEQRRDENIQSEKFRQRLKENPDIFLGNINEI